MRYIIVGGVAGGASFACRLRREDEEAEIVIYEKSGFVSYANCGLPYFLSGTIKEKQNLVLQTPVSLHKRFNLEVYVHSEVISIDPKGHTVSVKNLLDGSIKTDHYDKLILSPGAEAIRLVPLSERVYELKTVEDAYRLQGFLAAYKPNNAIVVGGGFIGVETLENLVEAGLEVTLVEGKSHCLANFDADMARFVEGEMERHGVKVMTNTKVEAIEDGANEVKVATDKGNFTTDLLVQAVGVRPASSLAKQAGLELGIRNTIKVDKHYQTSDRDIYAIGDATSVISGIDAEPAYIALAGLANKEGRELASFLATGKDFAISGLGTSVLKVFDLAAGSTGFIEEQLKAKGMDYDKIYLSPANHATYYPGASTLLMKVLFNHEGAILGAQVVGKEGVDKRIDVLSMVIKNQLGYQALKEAELSYAPPFGSAKDPINMAGFMIENILTGRVKQFFREDLPAIQADPHNLLVDVRTKAEYDAFHIAGAINIPVDELRDRLSELPKDRHIRLLCHSAIRSYIAARILAQMGYECSHLSGGYVFY